MALSFGQGWNAATHAVIELLRARGHNVLADQVKAHLTGMSKPDKLIVAIHARRAAQEEFNEPIDD